MASLTPRQFAKALLKAGGYPASENNIGTLVTWMAQEGGHWANSAWYNPLNTSQRMPGDHPAVGFIPAYTSWDQGIAATLKTINYGAYKNIRAALAASEPPASAFQAINASPWTGTPPTPYPSNNPANHDAYANRTDPHPGALSFALSAPWFLQGTALAAVGGLALAAGYYLYEKAK